MKAKIRLDFLTYTEIIGLLSYAKGAIHGIETQLAGEFRNRVESMRLKLEESISTVTEKIEKSIKPEKS